MISQSEFIGQCVLKYRHECIPEGERWEGAHYPTPECKGGVNVINLWISDHAAHNIIQSEEIGHPCVFGWELRFLTGRYSYLVPYYHKWKRISCQMGGERIKEAGLGIFSEGQQSLGGKITQTEKLGLFGLSPENKKEAERKGGRTAGKLPRWTNGKSNRYCEEKPGSGWWRGVTRKRRSEA
jgi:hypothetical protein